MSEQETLLLAVQDDKGQTAQEVGAGAWLPRAQLSVKEVSDSTLASSSAKAEAGAVGKG